MSHHESKTSLFKMFNPPEDGDKTVVALNCGKFDLLYAMFYYLLTYSAGLQLNATRKIKTLRCNLPQHVLFCSVCDITCW